MTDLIHPALTHRWITTYSGERVAAPMLTVSQVKLPDIARSLAMQCRYLGHISKFYSVAEHSILVARMAQAAKESPETVRAALFHDAHEAYTGDFPSPFKEIVLGLRDFERDVEGVVHAALDLPMPDHPLWDRVKKYDTRALHFEAARLLKAEPGWIDYQQVLLVPSYLNIRSLAWEEGMQMFLFEATEGMGRK